MEKILTYGYGDVFTRKTFCLLCYKLIVIIISSSSIYKLAIFMSDFCKTHFYKPLRTIRGSVRWCDVRNNQIMLKTQISQQEYILIYK